MLLGSLSYVFIVGSNAGVLLATNSFRLFPQF